MSRTNATRESKGFGHDPDDGIRFAVNDNAAADNVAIGSEMIAPEVVAQHNHVALAGLIFVGRKGAAEQRLDAKQGKEVRGDGCGLDGFGTFRAADGEGSKAVGCHVLKRGVLALPVQIVGGRNRKHGHAGEALGRRNVPDLHDAGRVFERQRAKKDGVDDGENGGVGPDAQGEHYDGRDREPRIAAQDAQGKAEFRKQVSCGHGDTPVTVRWVKAVTLIRTEETGKSFPKIATVVIHKVGVEEADREHSIVA